MKGTEYRHNGYRKKPRLGYAIKNKNKQNKNTRIVLKYINTLMKTTFMIIKHAHEKYRAPRHNGNRYQKKPKLGYDLKKGKINSLSFKSLNANTKTFW